MDDLFDYLDKRIEEKNKEDEEEKHELGTMHANNSTQ